MLGLIMLASFPLMLLNILGSVVGGIWLAIVGDWSAIGFGLALIIGGAFVCSLLILPGMIFSLPGVRMWESNTTILVRVFAIPLMLLGLVWTWAAMAVWAIVSFLLIVKNAPDFANILGYLLWAYGAATGPWMFMAQKDAQAGNEYSSVPCFFLQWACVIFGIGIWLQASWMIIAPLIILLVGLAIQIFEFGILAITPSKKL